MATFLLIITSGIWIKLGSLIVNIVKSLQTYLLRSPCHASDPSDTSISSSKRHRLMSSSQRHAVRPQGFGERSEPSKIIALTISPWKQWGVGEHIRMMWLCTNNRIMQNRCACLWGKDVKQSSMGALSDPTRFNWSLRPFNQSSNLVRDMWKLITCNPNQEDFLATGGWTWLTNYDKDKMWQENSPAVEITACLKAPCSCAKESTRGATSWKVQTSCWLVGRDTKSPSLGFQLAVFCWSLGQKGFLTRLKGFDITPKVRRSSSCSSCLGLGRNLSFFEANPAATAQKYRRVVLGPTACFKIWGT